MKMKILLVIFVFSFGLLQAEVDEKIKLTEQELVQLIEKQVLVDQNEFLFEQAEDSILDDLVMAGLAIGYVYVFEYVFTNARRTDFDAEEWMPYFDW